MTSRNFLYLLATAWLTFAILHTAKHHNTGPLIVWLILAALTFWRFQRPPKEDDNNDSPKEN